ncbi:MAG: hypothetical protein NZ879_04610 [Archaeoglobaceae archaeon]|nr:hypothetical protein [Archaeoglobaceae archaeon]MDW8118245.1 hypothetical protein [Archaeoglobaceae archaeon]
MIIKLNSKFDEISEKYMIKKSLIDSVVFALVLALSSFILLKLTSYFSEKWVLLISALNFIIALKRPKISLAILVITTSLSILYQDFFVGIAVFMALLYLYSYFNENEKIMNALFISIIPLMFYRVEFFAIIAVSIIYGYRRGLKISALAIFAGIFFTLVLPYNSFGHFNPDLRSPPIPNLKTPQESISISNLFTTSKFEFSRFESFINSIANSNSLPIIIVGYILFGVIPSYVKDVTERFRRLYTLIGLVVSTNLTIFVISSLSQSLQVFASNIESLINLTLSSILAWLLYTFLSINQPERGDQTEEIENSSQINVMGKIDLKVSETGKGRLEALRREIDRGGKN